MALSESAKKNLILGGGLLAVAGIFLWSRRAKAEKREAAAEPILRKEGVMELPTASAVTAGTTVAPPAPGAADKLLTVQRDQSWSSIARDTYGDWRWFPFLWDYNRTASTQFEDADRLDKGTTIKIPALPPGEAFKKAIFARSAAYVAFRKRSRGALPPEVTDRTPVPTQTVAEPIPPVAASAASPVGA
jgi:hypothetical protein